MIQPSPSSRNILRHHTDMVTELSEMFSLGSKEWRSICSRVEMMKYVSTRDIGDVKDMFGLCNALKKKGTIDYGKYGKLRDMLVNYDVETGNTIDKYTNQIREEREVDRVSPVMDSREDDSTENGNIIHMDDTDMQQVHEEENDDLDLVMEEVEYPAQPVNKSQLDKRRFIQQRTETVVVRNPKFIETVDVVDHDKYEVAMGRSNEENEKVVQDSTTQQSAAMIQQSMGIVQQVTPTFTYKQMGVTHPQVNLNLWGTDDEKEMEVEDDEDRPFKKPKMMKRCKCWPVCAKGNACSYHHPNAPCKMFPHCKFGDRCLYIHPNCKFDAKCTRKDCHYTHASKRVTVATTVIQKIVPEAIPASGPASIRPSNMSTTSISVSCTFHPNCKNMYCQFAHPRPCRYGTYCMKKGKCAFYHPALPTKDKLKWTAGKTSDDHKSCLISKREEDIESAKDRYSEIIGKQSDLEQNGRKNSLIIAGLKDPGECESVEDCVETVVSFVRDTLKLPIQSSDINIAHRLGKSNGPRPRYVIVKFTHRRKQQEIIHARKNLKGSHFVIFEDLTRFNQQRLTEAYSMDCVKNSYSVDGQLFVILKNGKKRKLLFETPLEENFLLNDLNFVTRK